LSRRSRDNYVSPEWNLGKVQRTLGKICRTAANLDNYSNRMFFWIIIVFSSREEKFFHTLSLIKGCEEKKSERLENGYCPVEKTMIIQEKCFAVYFEKIYCVGFSNSNFPPLFKKCEERRIFWLLVMVMIQTPIPILLLFILC